MKGEEHTQLLVWELAELLWVSKPTLKQIAEESLAKATILKQLKSPFWSHFVPS